MAGQERWGVWITQDKPRRGRASPDAYWWQGPDYYGDCVMTREQAETTARRFQQESPSWRYEPRLYVPKTA